MAREKSEFKSGMGNSMRNYLKLVEAVEDLGGGDDQLKRIETDATLRVEIAKLIVGQSQNGTGDSHQVTVDYSQSLEQMIAAGRYDWKNDDIKAKHFPVKGEGKVDLEITLVHYNRVMNTDDVLKDLDQRGLRPIKSEELLALGANEKTRDLQRQFPIIALGSVWQDLDGRRYCPYLYGHGSKRRLSLHWFDYGFHEVCRFAAVRK